MACLPANASRLWPIHAFSAGEGTCDCGKTMGPGAVYWIHRGQPTPKK